MKKKDQPIAKPAQRTTFPWGQLKVEIVVPYDEFGYKLRAGFKDGEKLFAAMPATFVEVEQGQQIPSLLSIDDRELEMLRMGVEERLIRTKPTDSEVVSLLKAEIAHLREVVLLLAGKRAHETDMPLRCQHRDQR